MTCDFQKYVLHFKTPGGTSRGILHDKETYFIRLKDKNKTAYGECNLFKGLSYDDRKGYEEKLVEVCQRLPVEKENLFAALTDWPSIVFGVETVWKDWVHGGQQQIFPQSIKETGFMVPINGLVWMGAKKDMMAQIKTKLEAGYQSIKLKIGAIDFKTELALIQFIRQQLPEKELEIRVDANGAWEYEEAKIKLEQIAKYDISYIEQPIKAGNWEKMAALTETTPVKIALDEELIGINTSKERLQLIQTIHPQLLVLKPALIGGFKAADEWKKLIEEQGGSWVITSALESNIGLNAIAQYAALGWSEYAQGLGTGQLFTNNIPGPYTVDAEGLHYHLDKEWNFNMLR